MQRIIYNKQVQTVKISAFLAVFGNDVWEKNYQTLHNNLYRDSDNSKVINVSKWRIIRVSCFYLGVLSTLFCVLINVYNYYINNTNISSIREVAMVNFIPSFVSIILLLLMSAYSQNALNSKRLLEKYIGNFNAQKLKIEQSTSA